MLNSAIKLKDTNYKSHWNILAFCDQWKMIPDLNMSLHRKMSDFVSCSLFGSTLVIKLGNPDFGSHWNTVMFFDKKDMTWDLNMFQGKMSDFVSLRQSVNYENAYNFRFIASNLHLFIEVSDWYNFQAVT